MKVVFDKRKTEAKRYVAEIEAGDKKIAEIEALITEIDATAALLKNNIATLAGLKGISPENKQLLLDQARQMQVKLLQSKRGFARQRKLLIEANICYKGLLGLIEKKIAPEVLASYLRVDRLSN